LATIGKNTRLKFFNRRKQLRSHGAVNFERWPVSDFEGFASVLNNWHLDRWDKPCFSDEYLLFIARITDWLDAESGLFCHALTVGGSPVTVSLDFLRGSRLYNIQRGYRPNFDKKISLGLLMFGYVAETTFENGNINSYDLLAGTGKNITYKERISKSSDKFLGLRVCLGITKYIYRFYDNFFAIKGLL
jgi:CelD/BcsL family acetyltransferase involved in cellulose biosynthesis